jgi:hypothetical protein
MYFVNIFTFTIIKFPLSSNSLCYLHSRNASKDYIILGDSATLLKKKQST